MEVTVYYYSNSLWLNMELFINIVETFITATNVLNLICIDENVTKHDPKHLN